MTTPLCTGSCPCGCPCADGELRWKLGRRRRAQQQRRNRSSTPHSAVLRDAHVSLIQAVEVLLQVDGAVKTVVEEESDDVGPDVVGGGT